MSEVRPCTVLDAAVAAFVSGLMDTYGAEDINAAFAGIGYLRRSAAMDDAARICEEIGEEYDRTEGGKWPELKADATTGARACEAAIRSSISENPQP